MGNLLGVPIHRLMEQLSTEAVTDLERRLVQGLYTLTNTNMCSSDRDVQSKSTTSGDTAIEDMLWVDRYRPRKFIDLLGNERVARDALTWVKQWDWCVFGKSRGKKRTRDGDENINLDELHRPQEKV